MLWLVAQPALCDGSPCDTSCMSIFIFPTSQPIFWVSHVLQCSSLVGSKFFNDAHPVYLRSRIHVPNNPSGTSCMSIFILSYEFYKSLVATTVCLQCFLLLRFRWLWGRPVYFRNRYVVTDNPSDTSCVSTFIFSAQFASSWKPMLSYFTNL